MVTPRLIDVKRHPRRLSRLFRNVPLVNLLEVSPPGDPRRVPLPLSSGRLSPRMIRQRHPLRLTIWGGSLLLDGRSGWCRGAEQLWKTLMRDEASLAIGTVAVHLADRANPAGNFTIYAGAGEPTWWQTGRRRSA